MSTYQTLLDKKKPIEISEYLCLFSAQLIFALVFILSLMKKQEKITIWNYPIGLIRMIRKKEKKIIVTSKKTNVILLSWDIHN